ncbi:MAG: MBL fold metallo-hydrolase [Bacteriovoracaceae bacterium]|jgi:hydroxyacylglutathione hydrolase|nr:MBL fold metallo-hydrolase [Bacteriovoracaceae bacterium]
MSQLKLETFPMGSFACNCSLVYDDISKEAIIVDPGNDLNGILTKVQERKLDVKYLLHTHAHFDHIGCAKCLKDELGSKILLHREDENLYKALNQQASMFNQPPAEVGTIDQYLEDEMEFSLNNQNLKDFIKTIFTPGHTEGSCCFYSEIFSEPILFSGDTLFQNSIGRTDLPGGDFDTIKNSIKKRLYQLPSETKVITGHGPSTFIHHERKFNPFVSA